MKKSYREHFDQIKLKKDYKEDILEKVLNYEEKKPRRIIIKPEVIALVMIAILLLVTPLIQNKNLFDVIKENNFTIKADENVFQIKNSTIEFRNFEQSITGYSLGYDNNEGLITTNPLYSPLCVYFNGDNIKSITYTIEDAYFHKINEGNLINVDNEKTDEDCQGCVGMMKTENSFLYLTKKGSLLPGNPEKKDWWFKENLSENQIIIEYEKQKTIEGLYGISFHIIDKQLVDAWNDTISESSSDNGQPSKSFVQARLAIKKRIAETINNTKMDIRVDYLDGTYETTQLKFKLDDTNNTQITK